MKTIKPILIQAGRLYTSAETASYLHLRLNTLAIWRSIGSHPELRFVRVGRRVVYRGEDILAFIEAGRSLSKGKPPRK